MAVTVRDYLVEHAPVGGLDHSRTMPAVFAAAVDVRGDTPAVFDGDRIRTWAQWRAQSHAFAAGLAELGVGAGDVVGVRLPNCWEFLLAHVAVADLGAVLMPLHMGLGRRELRSLLRRVGAKVVVLPATRHGGIGAGLGRALRAEVDSLEHVLSAGEEAGIGSLSGLLARWAGRRPAPVRVDSDMPFVLMASSGTTSARPKICIHTHGGLLSNAAQVAVDGRARIDDTIVSASAFTHLFGLLSVHLGVLVGCRQSLLPGWDVDALAGTLRSDSTVLFAVPAQLRDVVSRLRADRVGMAIRLREVRTGGAAVPGALVTELAELTGARTVVQWGMSEVGAGTFTGPDDPAEVASRSIGRPITGSRARVVDEHGRPCALGEVGELQYRGPNLFRGYLGEPELTRAAFSADGWLRTGDRAVRNADETLAYRGRDAETINVGGLKFAASEVEGVVGELAQVDTVAVAGRPDERLGEYPYLIVSLRPGATLGLADVTAHLAHREVAEYKWPLELIVVDEVPVTPTGKIARGRLAEVLAGPGGGSAGAEGWAAQATDVGRMAAAMALVCEVAFGAEPAPDPDRSFAEHGLDSAAAVRLAVRLSERTGLRLPTTVVFDHPTPRALARRVVAAGGADGSEGEGGSGGGGGGGDDPVVIVGMGCRFPGGIRSPEDLWRALVDGRDVISAFPVDRGWDVGGPADPDPTRVGAAAVRHGGFLSDVADFDAAFFGITPSEARSMDPQQRLLLETAWEAIERAGIDPLSLHGSDTGVFVGMMASDYAPGVFEAPELFDGRLLTGNAASVASGRISYVLGLSGPALTVDTACSSSLVALHLASRSLRDRECSLALVGGATVMSTPASFVDFGRQGALAEDGRCKAFAAAADGAGWAEGVGTLVLERLSDARRAGHRVLAVLRGSAINQDGASNGLTAPNGLAQRRVIRRALADAGLTADQVDVVEAHGTGTTLGDPIEAGALIEAYGRDRERPLWLGSVKSNLGHTQAAAGIAGVLKTVLALGHGTLPRTLHVDAPSPHVDWSGGAVRLLVDPTPWPASARPRIAGVSAFGISGTNAHVLLAEAPCVPVPVPVPEVPGVPGVSGAELPWVLSAKTAPALRALADRLGAADAARYREPADVGRALAATRSTFEHRAVVVAGERPALLAGLRALGAGLPAPDVVAGTAAGRTGKTVFVFPGQGAQRPGSARELLDTSAVFAASVAACDDAFAAHVDWSVRDVLRDECAPALRDRADVAQAALFTVMVSLAALWRAHGVRPDAVVGHSQGEVAAAHVCGALSLADAARVIAARGRAVRELGGGAMMSVALAPGALISRPALRSGRLSIAAVNGPRSVVLAGAAPAVDELLAELAAEGVRVARLPVAYASHSPHVEQVERRLLDSLAGLEPRAGDIAFVSGMDASRSDTRTLTAEYWYQNLRRPVEFAAAIETLLDRGHRTFVELSPHPVLLPAIEDTAEASGTEVLTVGSLRRDDGGSRRFLLSVADAYVRGVSVDWGAAFAPGSYPHVELPTYPFCGARYWLRTGPARGGSAGPLPVERAPAVEPGFEPGFEARFAVGRPGDPAAVLDLVRRHAAALSGHADGDEITADRAFQELGFDSLAGAALRRRLGDALGIPLPTAVMFDHPTPRRLSAYLWDRLVGVDELPDGLGELFRRASESGRVAVGLDLVRGASLLRADFGADEDLDAHGSEPVRLSRGDYRSPVLLCLPSVVAMGGPHEYARLAARFAGVREVCALAQPGFLAGERLPRDLAALVAAHVRTVERSFGAASLVLCGHSSGGLVAQAVAAGLEAIGRPAAGLVLIDTYWPDPAFLADVLPELLVPATVTANSTRLTAMGGYLRILTNQPPDPVTTPTLYLRATRPPAGPRPGDHRPVWPLPHTLVEVPGDHFGVLDTDVGAVAEAVESWQALARPHELPHDASVHLPG